jgi:exportin-2 (importin alpha re-exporter)
VTDLFLSLSSQDIPAQFEEPGVLKAWFSRFIELLQYNNPVLESLASKRADPDEPTRLELLKASICDVLNLYAWKYEDHLAEFVPPAVTAIWGVLSTLSAARRFDPLVGSAIRFLTSVVKKEQFKHLFASEAVLSTLAEKVVIPQIKLRDSDVETFESNPQEYIRVDIEVSRMEVGGRPTLQTCAFFVQSVCLLLTTYPFALCFVFCP